MAFEYNATLVGRVEVAPGLLMLRVAPDQRPFEFKPGQYVTLGLKASEPKVDGADPDGPSLDSGDTSYGTPDSRLAVDAQAAAIAVAEADTERMIRRAYCIASESRAVKYLEFYMTMISSGELTPRIFNLKAGDRLHIGSEATGIFTLEKWSEKNILMIGTATGVAPYMSMLRNELMVKVNGHFGQRAAWQCNGWRRFVLVHGARYSWDLGYRTELTGLAKGCENFHYLPAITKPEEDTTWRGMTGYLQNIIASGVIEKETGLKITPDNFELFLCGNPGMVQTIIPWAEARGFTRAHSDAPGTLHVEEYWYAPPARTASGR